MRSQTISWIRERSRTVQLQGGNDVDYGDAVSVPEWIRLSEIENKRIQLCGKRNAFLLRNPTVTKGQKLRRPGGPAKRLKDSGRPQKVLKVPQKDMARAAEAMRSLGISGTVKNMGSTGRRSVPKKK